MKILVVGYFGPSNGHGHYCRAFADALEARGNEVARCDHREVPSPWYVRFAAARKVDRGLREVANSRAVALALKRTTFDVVHFQMVTPVVDRWWLPRAVSARRAVMTVHNVEPHGRAFEDHPRFVRPIYAAMARLVVHTDGNRARFAALHPELAARVRVVPHGVREPRALPSREDARRALGLASGRPVVLFFGIIRPNKGLDLLLHAIAVLRARAPDRAPIVLVAGSLPGGARFEPYAEVARANGIADLLDARLGFVAEDDVPLYFAASDVIALPYELGFQAQSGVLVDAYTYGVPVVATQAGGIGETVARDGTGLVARERSAEGFAEVLERACSDDMERARMKSRMLVLAEGEYGWRRVAERTEAVYRELLGAEDASRSPMMEART